MFFIPLTELPSFVISLQDEKILLAFLVQCYLQQILSFVSYLKIMGSFDNSPFSTTVSYIFQFLEVSLVNSLVHFFPEFLIHTRIHNTLNMHTQTRLQAHTTDTHKHWHPWRQPSWMAGSRI